MEETTALTFSGYAAYKNNFDAVVRRSTEDFVQIGYLLKYARDTNILAGSGYDTIAEFAQAEYGLEKTQVSRFMAINDRFSKGGYSYELDDKYKGFGSAKLGIMLTLSEEVAAELSPDMSKADINVIKHEIEEENKITDFEVMYEGTEQATEELTEKDKVVREFMKTYPQEYKEMHQWWCKADGPFPEISENELMEIFAPNGSKTFMVRVQGLGKYMVTFGMGKPVSILNVRNNEKMEQTLTQWVNATCAWIDTNLNPLKSYSKFFGDGEQPETQMEKPKDVKAKVQVPHKEIVTPKPENKEVVSEEAALPEKEQEAAEFMPKPEVIEGEYREVAPEQQEPKFEVHEIPEEVTNGEPLDLEHHKLMALQFMNEAFDYVNEPDSKKKEWQMALELANKAIIELILMIKAAGESE